MKNHKSVSAIITPNIEAEGFSFNIRVNADGKRQIVNYDSKDFTVCTKNGESNITLSDSLICGLIKAKSVRDSMQEIIAYLTKDNAYDLSILDDKKTVTDLLDAYISEKDAGCTPNLDNITAGLINVCRYKNKKECHV